MANRNASASIFGWDFQINAAIVLMLENIKYAKQVRVEGHDEDIEVTLQENKKIYAQVKSVARPDDYTNVIAKLNAALESLNQAADNNDGILFSYITNSNNPFNDRNSISFFYGYTHLYFDELPQEAQKKITDEISKKEYINLKTDKFDIRVIPFYGIDPKNKYKHIKDIIGDFCYDCKINYDGISNDIMHIWQRDFFRNACIPDTTICINKKDMIWPLIVLAMNKVDGNYLKNELNDDEIIEINSRYKAIINYESNSYKIITKVIKGKMISGLNNKEYIETNWKKYLELISEIDAEEYIKEKIIKLILHKILVNKTCIDSIKKVVNL